MDPEGTLAQTIPEGFEIYENIGGQVFLRRKLPQIIQDAELAMVIYETDDRTEFYRTIAMPWGTRVRCGRRRTRR